MVRGMVTELLLGDEAVAQAALDAGIRGAFSYPGTPATEIFEYVSTRRPDPTTVAARWSANEKVAYEEALGMSYVGHRALVSMKHVGLNVASDPFMNSALTGVVGGLVVAVADDPSMHSSQNEQDSRYYGEFAKLPMFEPHSQQEAYDMTREGFDYSEAVGLPVMLRLVTRLAHSRANVTVRAPDPERQGGLGRPNPNDWTLVPTNARRRFDHLLDVQGRLLEDSERSAYNRLRLASGRGVITTGLALNYLREAVGERHDLSHLHIGRYPIPVSLVRDLVAHCDDILVLEEGYPFVEKHLRGLLGLHGKAVRGRMSGAVSLSGELTPDTVAAALGIRLAHETLPPLPDLAGRPPQLCRGCPHVDSFRALVEATSGYKEAVLFGDIGCYTLGVMPPFRAIQSCVDMGSSISMAHGAAQAGVHPVVCTIGESTFAHSGMTGLLGAARSDSNMTVLILDNAVVAMTGGQDTALADERLVGVVRALGVSSEHVHVIDPIPRNHAENVAVMKRAIEHPGLSVVIARRACVQIPAIARRPKQGDAALA